MHLSSLFFEEEKLEWEPINEKVKRQIVGFDDRIMMATVLFEKGGVGSLHSHHHSQVSYISEGIFKVTIDGAVKILKKGDSFYVPSNKEHGVVCLERGKLIDVFSPKREDFIK